MKIILALCIAAFPLAPSMTPSGKGVYEVSYDLETSFGDRVKAAKFKWVDPTATGDRFGRDGCGKETADLRIIYLDRFVTTEKALSEIAKRKLRPATADELVAFATDYPKFVKSYPVVALGTVWSGGRDRVGRVLFAGPHEGETKLDVEETRVEWTMSYRFLAARE